MTHRRDVIYLAATPLIGGIAARGKRRALTERRSLSAHQSGKAAKYSGARSSPAVSDLAARNTTATIQYLRGRPKSKRRRSLTMTPEEQQVSVSVLDFKSTRAIISVLEWLKK